MTCTVTSMMCAALLSAHVGPEGWLFLAIPEPIKSVRPRGPDVTVALVDGVRSAPAYATGAWWHENRAGMDDRPTDPPVVLAPWQGVPIITHRVVAVQPPDDAGAHTLTVIFGDEVWVVDYWLHPWLDAWHDRGSAFEWWGSDRPRMHAPFGHRQLSFAYRHDVLDVRASDLGLLVWREDGRGLVVVPEPRLVLRRPQRIPIRCSECDVGDFPQPPDDWTTYRAPAVVRAILSDGTLGSAWFVDDELVLADEPEIEDGRYELLNADGSVRW